MLIIVLVLVLVRQIWELQVFNTAITLTASSGKRNVTVWRPTVCPSVCLSVPSAYLPWLTGGGAACDAASVHFGPTIRITDILVWLIKCYVHSFVYRVIDIDLLSMLVYAYTMLLTRHFLNLADCWLSLVATISPVFCISPCRLQVKSLFLSTPLKA